MSIRTVAIHQPNFFPWLGYFQKIAKADVFVFLTEADYPKSGSSMSSYVNRVKLAVGGEAQWWGCPLVRESGPQRIADVQIRNEPWAKKKLRTLEQSYSKAPFFKEFTEEIRDMVLRPEQSLAAYNMANLRRVCDLLGLETEFVVDTEFGVEGAATERLINIIKAVGGTSYLSGSGGDNYQEQKVFEQEGIELSYVNFQPRAYAQVKTAEFLSGLSILDGLCNLGPAEVAGLVG